MTVLQTIILGAVQGLTAFLPISGSGHVILLGQVFGAESSVSLSYLLWLQAGTLAAVVLFYRREVLNLLIQAVGMLLDMITNVIILVRPARKGRRKEYHRIVTGSYRKFIVTLLLSMIPLLILGILLHSLVTFAVSHLLITAIGFLVSGLIICVASFSQRGVRGASLVRPRDALLIGTMEGLSVIPGISRAGMISSGTELSHLGPKFTERFAVFSSIPVILAAVIFEAGNGSVHAWSAAGPMTCVLGFAVSCIVTLVTLRFSLRILKQRRNMFFAVYSGVMGVITVMVYLMS